MSSIAIMISIMLTQAAEEQQPMISSIDGL